MNPLFVAAIYKFVKLADCAALRESLLAQCDALGISGTLLLAEEGINGTIAGTRSSKRPIQSKRSAAKLLALFKYPAPI